MLLISDAWEDAFLASNQGPQYSPRAIKRSESVIRGGAHSIWSCAISRKIQ